ncbi:YkvS family protein [Corticicoccus populi]|uniref:YkvS family protein n=1 Tax=Corticicoccus populi TaxID=1812821 RepID=A0ABW5WVM5_9STAP
MEEAKVGSIVEFDGMKGKVEKVNENSVIVDITMNENFDEHEMFEKTVVNHKRYKIIQEA